MKNRADISRAGRTRRTLSIVKEGCRKKNKVVDREKYCKQKKLVNRRTKLSIDEKGCRQKEKVAQQKKTDAYIDIRLPT